MGFFKKAKNIKLLALSVTTVGLPVATTVGVLASGKQVNSTSVMKLITHLQPKNNNIQKLTNPDFKGATPSINDQNLKDLPPNQQPVFELPPPVKILDDPAPPPPTPQPDNQYDSPPSPYVPPVIPKEAVSETLQYDGLTLNVKILRAPNRKYSQADIERGITNRIPYRSQIVDEVVGVQVTEELKAKVAANVRSALSNQINGQVKKFFEDAAVTNDAQIGALVLQNQAYYDGLFEKYKALFDNGDKVRDFLTDAGQKEYPQIKSEYQKNYNAAQAQYQQASANLEAWFNRPPSYTQTDEGQNEYKRLYKLKVEAEQAEYKAKSVKYIKLLERLDFNKFKPASQVDQDLAKGLTINPDNANVYVDKDGNVNSYSRSPLTNNTIAVLSRDNAQRRAFGISGYFGRGGDSIEDGNWPGWTKKDVTSEYAKYDSNISAANGISVDQYDKQASNKAETKRNHGVVVTVDVANPAGYAHIKEVIENLKKKKIEITGYRIRNIGLNDDNQQMSDIIAALPDHLPLLEVWVESPKGDTSGLNPLENKQIDELSIYTTNNSLRSSWSIDPWALKNVAWVNTIDYNVSSEYAPGLKVPSRVTFNYLSFADTDYNGDHKYDRINDGLRMAYWVRNNEKVFQGYFGGGLNPDKDEQGNSYIMGLDLSHVSKTRSLEGLQFGDIMNPNRPPRKLKWIKLYSDGPSFNISAQELNKAQFSTVLDTSAFQQPRSNISFGNGNTTTTITVTGAGLTPAGITNLQTLLNWSDNFSLLKLRTPIHADNPSTVSILKAAGFNVQSGPVLIGS